MREDYNRADYDIDFPDQGNWNWKMVKITMPDDVYYNGAEIIGVLLHDGNFMINGVMFEKHEFKIIEHDPLMFQKQMRQTFEQYLLKNSKIMKGEIEFRLVINKISGDEDDNSSIRVRIQPVDRAGDPVYAEIEGNNITPIEGE